MADWQPIETAPIDGTRILVFGGRQDYLIDADEDAGAEMFAVAYWDQFLNWDEGNWRFCCYDGGFYGEWEFPTHWMPLPEVPELKDGGIVNNNEKQ